MPQDAEACGFGKACAILIPPTPDRAATNPKGAKRPRSCSRRNPECNLHGLDKGWTNPNKTRRALNVVDAGDLNAEELRTGEITEAGALCRTGACGTAGCMRVPSKTFSSSSEVQEEQLQCIQAVTRDGCNSTGQPRTWLNHRGGGRQVLLRACYGDPRAAAASANPAWRSIRHAKARQATVKPCGATKPCLHQTAHCNKGRVSSVPGIPPPPSPKHKTQQISECTRWHA